MRAENLMIDENVCCLQCIELQRTNCMYPLCPVYLVPSTISLDVSRIAFLLCVSMARKIASSL